LRAPPMAQDLSPGRRTLVELMYEHQFGRIENMPIREGQPILDSNLKVVRVARFGCRDAAKVSRFDDFELKCQIQDLFEELARLQNATVIRLEFRAGVPFLLETSERVR